MRGRQLAKSGLNRVTADQMGMLATAINGLALRDAIEQENIPTRLVSALLISGMLERHNPRAINRYLKEGDIVIICGGTGNPFFHYGYCRLFAGDRDKCGYYVQSNQSGRDL